jgi:hypothetical protein
MVNEKGVVACLARLFSVIREGEASDLSNLLDCDDFDFDTTARALQLLFEQSEPKDWENASRWFLPEAWYRLGAFVDPGSSVEQGIVLSMRRWLSEPRWAVDRLGGLRGFAEDFLYFRDTPTE